jgi:hypothetical protein
MAPPAFADDYPAGRSRSPQNPPPRPHVQILPTRYSAPDSASPPCQQQGATEISRRAAETYSPRATSPNPNLNIRASGLSESVTSHHHEAALREKMTECERSRTAAAEAREHVLKEVNRGKFPASVLMPGPSVNRLMLGFNYCT